MYVADAQSPGGPLADVAPVEKILLELHLGNEVRGLVVELRQLSHQAGVGCLRGVGKPGDFNDLLGD